MVNRRVLRERLFENGLHAGAKPGNICHKKKHHGPREIIDNNWYKAKNLIGLSSVNVDCDSAVANAQKYKPQYTGVT